MALLLYYLKNNNILKQIFRIKYSYPHNTINLDKYMNTIKNQKIFKKNKCKYMKNNI